MVWAVSLSTTKLISRSPTATLFNTGIRSLKEFGNRLGPYLYQCSTSRIQRCDASPKTISARTSYLQVRLAFHP